MKASKKTKVLVSGASIAGLATAYWLNRLGYDVTVVEQAGGLREGGTAVDLRGATIGVVKRMGLFEPLNRQRLGLERMEFKGADDETIRSFPVGGGDSPDDADADIEIERDRLVSILFEAVKAEVRFAFGNSIAGLQETAGGLSVSFRDGTVEDYALVFGCDGTHSAVRKLWFGCEATCTHFLQGYFSISIADKLLIPEKTMQLYNVPGKVVMLNAYRGKTDLVFAFASEQPLSYDYRDTAQQKAIVLEHFAGERWRTAELLAETEEARSFYFDQFCQIKLPSWTKGRVALVGDAAHCASQAAGMGASLAMDGAAALAAALEAHGDDFESAFAAYDSSFRPFAEEVQAMAEHHGMAAFLPRTEEAIRARNEAENPF